MKSSPMFLCRERKCVKALVIKNIELSNTSLRCLHSKEQTRFYSSIVRRWERADFELVLARPPIGPSIFSAVPRLLCLLVGTRGQCILLKWNVILFTVTDANCCGHYPLSVSLRHHVACGTEAYHELSAFLNKSGQTVTLFRFKSRPEHLAMVPEDFRGFPQFLQADARIVYLIMSRSLCPIYFPVRCSLIVLPLDAV